MKILFISREGDSLGLAFKCSKEKFAVEMYTVEDTLQGMGLIPCIPTEEYKIEKNGHTLFSSELTRLLGDSKPDIVFVDGRDMGGITDFCRESGVAVVGPTVWTDTLARDCNYMLNICKVNKLPIKQDNGEEINIHAILLWNGMKSIAKCLTFNIDKMMVGDLGATVPSCGQAIIPNIYLPMFSQVIEKVEELLKKVRFRGIFDIELSVTSSSISVTSLSSNIQFLPSLVESYKGSLTDLIQSVSIGKDCLGELTSDVVISILLSIPPYPIVKAHSQKGEKYSAILKGVNEYNRPHLYLMNVCQPLTIMEIANGDGRLLWASARGRNYREADRRVYNTLSNVTVENAQYRTDIGSCVDKAVRTLNRLSCADNDKSGCSVPNVGGK